jgi:ABC-type transport system involved in cytochrome c biogenesis permease subunit
VTNEGSVVAMSVAMLTDLVSRVDAEARKVDPRRVALTAVAFPFLVLGLLVGVLFKVVWSAVSWAYAAIKVGFELGRELQVRGRSAGGG